MAFGMKSKKALWVFTAFVIAGIYDFAAVYVLDGFPSISLLTKNVGINLRFTDLVIGMVIGHLFFYMERPCSRPHSDGVNS